MPQILAVVTIPKKSGIPRDAVENTFAFATDAPADAAAATAITTQLNDFYGASHGAFGSVSSWLADSVDASGTWEAMYYDISGHLGGTAHGSPFGSGLITPGTIGTDSLPSELAACLSFRSNYGTDVEFGGGGATRPRARDRGRVFIGPIKKGAVEDSSTTQEGRIIGGLCQSIVSAADALKGDATYTWSVWSRKDATLKPVTVVWCDNAWDIQRRRGADATSRFSF